MAKFRTYKNGIYGSKYKGYYIVKDTLSSDKNFSIIKSDRELISSEIQNMKDCEWFIDKLVASEEEMKVIKELYEKEIFELSGIMLLLIQKKDNGKIEKYEEIMLSWIEKIRQRKAEDKQL